MYSKTWTLFETQSLAFGLLRKALYPRWLVRGDTGEIRVYKPTADVLNPELKLIIKIEATASKEGSGFTELPKDGDIRVFFLRGGDQAYKIPELISPYLI